MAHRKGNKNSFHFNHFPVRHEFSEIQKNSLWLCSMIGFVILDLSMQYINIHGRWGT